MKLHFAAASPFVRMVRVTALEGGIADRIELVPTGVFLPIEAHEAVVRDNPLGKIPALVLDDGAVLFDSRVICEYLADLSGSDTLLPASGAARWRVLTLQALAQGLADTGVNLRYETALRPEELRWDKWIDTNMTRIGRACDALSTQYSDVLASVNVGSISAAAALSYLDFRYPDYDWRGGRDSLANWHGTFSERPSMQSTLPE